MFEKTKTRVYRGPSNRYASLVTLPGDIGEEQLLLACLPNIRGKDGENVPCSLNYCPGRRAGNIYGEIVAERCPAEFSVSIKFILLMAPVLTDDQQRSIALTLSRRKPRSSRRQHVSPGFPAPDFTDGGPAFLDLPPGATYFETISSVLERARVAIQDSVDPRFATNQFMDPDLIRKTGKGGCVQLTRLAEKALVGVARSSYVVAFRDGIDVKDLARYPSQSPGFVYPGLGHAFLVVEDPESGNYFLADPSKAFPYLGPHPGNVIVERLLENDDHTLVVPSKIPWPIDKRRMLIDLDFSDQPVARMGNVTYTASSRHGPDAGRYRAWLDGAPAEFRHLAEAVNKSHHGTR